MLKTFRVAADRVVVMPKGIAPGPGGRASMHKPGELLTLTAAQAATRYIRNRLKLGDLVQVVASEPGRSDQ